jgi:hypothetical protein
LTGAGINTISNLKTLRDMLLMESGGKLHVICIVDRHMMAMVAAGEGIDIRGVAVADDGTINIRCLYAIDVGGNTTCIGDPLVAGNECLVISDNPQRFGMYSKVNDEDPDLVAYVYEIDKVVDEGYTYYQELGDKEKTALELLEFELKAADDKVPPADDEAD